MKLQVTHIYRYLRHLEEVANSRRNTVEKRAVDTSQRTRRTSSQELREHDGFTNPDLSSVIQRQSSLGAKSPSEQQTERQASPLSNGVLQGDADLSNPLASAMSAYLPDSSQRLRESISQSSDPIAHHLIGALGESSTWSFSRRTLVFLRDHLDHPESPNIDLNEEGSAYQLDWAPQGSDQALSVGNVPSIDYAIFLTNSVKFHIGQLFHLFDEAEFMYHLHEFYKDPLRKAQKNGLWYIQFLLVLALGKAVIVQSREGSSGPPGSDLFLRAMALMPTPAHLFSDALTAIELLCAVSLYFQLADLRNSALIYVSLRCLFFRRRHSSLHNRSSNVPMRYLLARLDWPSTTDGPHICLAS